MLVADEPDVATQRAPAHFPTCTTLVGPARDLVPKSDREDLGADPQPASDQVMAKLMDDDERSERADERDQDQPDWRLQQHQAQRSSIIAVTSVRTFRSISNTSSMDRGAGLSFS